MLGPRSLQVAIVGNKVDLLGAGELRAAQSAGGLIWEAQRLADELANGRHHLSSAKLGRGVGELFASLSRRMVEQRRRSAGSCERPLASARLVRPLPPAPDRQQAAGSGPAASSCQC